eukprot:CAMPEP_0185799626 /NCGR_PEP_ID=MMETSP1322-20130828/432_1 /TAXON_ID=265543 /ORGANISM="Minutocellus polymorphus, Strain RCC2270" /LENGTH=125 /DNA_ID=CAMNT_0028495211 /DNA_START=88 /DNA_END=465 /DNA_ORIENTATION=+
MAISSPTINWGYLGFALRCACLNRSASGPGSTMKHRPFNVMAAPVHFLSSNWSKSLTRRATPVCFCSMLNFLVFMFVLITITPSSGKYVNRISDKWDESSSRSTVARYANLQRSNTSLTTGGKSE